MPTKSGHTAAILTSKVIGTPVYSANAEKLGHIQDVMLDKLSDRLVFVVLAPSAGAGQHYLPIPWDMLDFDPGRQGYVIGLSDQQLKNAPVFGLDELTADDGAPARELTGRFYKTI